MRRSSVIIFGILSAILLIFSSIALNASNYYNAFEVSTNEHLSSKPMRVLHDRNLYTLKEID